MRRHEDEKRLGPGHSKSEFEEEMERLPKMQELVKERDERIKALRRELADREHELLELKALMIQVQQGRGLDLGLSRGLARDLEAGFMGLRHELRAKEEAIARIEREHQAEFEKAIRLERMSVEREHEVADEKKPKRKGFFR